MEEEIKNFIFEDIEVKKASNRPPYHCLYIDLQKWMVKKLNETLNEMYRNGEIEVGKTINDKWIKFK